MTKPTVKYIPSMWDVVMVGHRAIIKPIDHPSEFVSNQTEVITSPVISINDDGFETLNTFYKKESQNAVS